MFGSSEGESSTRRTGRAAAAGAAVGGCAVALILLVVAPVTGKGTNTEPAPAPQVIAATHPITHAQIAGARGMASISATRKKHRQQKTTGAASHRPTVTYVITDDPILTEEGKGTYIGVRCPAGSRPVSGGIVSSYINLLVSSSSPNKPTIDGKYTPNTWWLSVTNVNVDGNGGTLSWRAALTCLSPARLGRSK